MRTQDKFARVSGLLLLILIFASVAARADDDWDGANAKISQAVAQLGAALATKGIQVSEAGSTTLGLRYFTVKTSGGFQTQLTVHGSTPDELIGNLGQQVQAFAQIPAEQLTAIQKAHAALDSDKKRLAGLGLDGYLATADPPNLLYPNGDSQVISLTLSTNCSGAATLGEIYADEPSVTVGLSDLLPGRTAYPDSVLYHEGQLRAALLKNPSLLKGLAAAARANSLSCLSSAKKQALNDSASLLDYLAATQSVEESQGEGQAKVTTGGKLVGTGR